MRSLPTHAIARALLAGALVASTAIGAHATPQCPAWEETFVEPGADGIVYDSIVFDDGSGSALYVAGAFDRIHGLASPGIARWDGVAWSSVGGGIDGVVKCLEIFDDGGGPALFAGGEFTTAGAATVSNLAKWNGVAWSDVGGGVSVAAVPGVYALETWEDGFVNELYVAGSFNMAGATSASNVASWNGSSWSALGPGTNGWVHALETFDDGSGLALYVGGAFSSAGSGVAGFLARWNRTTWSGVGQQPGTTVRALHVHDDGVQPALFVGGLFTSIGGIFAKHVARWDGTNWSALANGVGNTPLAFTTFDDGTGPALFVGGIFKFANDAIQVNSVAKWNGAAWTGLSTGVTDGGGLQDMVYSLTPFAGASGDVLVVGGEFVAAGGSISSNLATWDGSQWNHAVRSDGLSIESAFSQPVGARALRVFDDGSGPKLFAAGNFSAAGGVVARMVARFDGSAWSNAATATIHHQNSDDYVDSMMTWDAGGGEQLYAGGHFGIFGSSSFFSIARWSGSSWSNIGDVWGGGATTSVRAMSVFNSQLHVAGIFAFAGAGPASHIARFDGVNWTPLGTGLNGGGLALARFDDGSGTKLFVGGGFNSAGGNPVSNIARWSGSTWSAAGAGLDATVNALVTFDDGTGAQLYAGGAFSFSGATPVSRIAKWNGSAWSAVGAGLDGDVFTLAVLDDGSGGGPALFAGGDFTMSGATPARRIAKWNGASWSEVAGGANGRVRAFASFAGVDGAAATIYVGGDFTEVGGVGASGIAALRTCGELGNAYCFGDGSATACPCGNPSALGAGQGCAHSVGHGASLEATGTTSVALDDQVFDAIGLPPGKPALLFSGVVQPGGGFGVAFGDGLLCVGGATKRHGVEFADASGHAAWGPGLHAQSNAWSPGSPRSFQVWFRDPAGPCASSFNFSSARELFFTP